MTIFFYDNQKVQGLRIYNVDDHGIVQVTHNTAVEGSDSNEKKQRQTR